MKIIKIEKTEKIKAFALAKIKQHLGELSQEERLMILFCGQIKEIKETAKKKKTNKGEQNGR